MTTIVTPVLDPHFAINSEQPALSAIRRIELSSSRIVVELSASCISRAHFEPLVEGAEFVRIEQAHDLARASNARRLLGVDSGDANAPRIDRALVRAIVQARRCQIMLASGEAKSIQDIAEREDVCPIYTGQLMPLAFLAPDLVEAILDGRQPPRLSLINLIKTTIPLRWSEQRALFAQFA